MDCVLLPAYVPFESVPTCAPVTVCHKRMVLSKLPLTSVLPSRLKATLLTVIRVPFERVFACAPVTASHRRMVLSQLPLASVPPSELNAKLS